MAKNFGYFRQSAISDDRQWVLMCCQDAIVLGEREASKRRLLFGHESATLCAAFSHSSQFIISGDRSGTILLWRTGGTDQRRTRLADLSMAGFRSIPEPPTSPGRDRIAFRTVSRQSGVSQEIKIADVRTHKISLLLPTASSPIAFINENALLTVKGLSFLERFNRIKPGWELGGTAPALEIWDLVALTNRSIALASVRNREVSAVGASADGSLIALAWRKGEKTNGAVLFSSATGDQHMSVAEIGSRIQGMAFSPNGEWLALASLDGTVQLVRVPSGEKGPKLRCDGVAESPAFSADGKWMAVACWDAVRVFSVPGWELSTTLIGNAFRVRFSADGKTLITHGGTFARWWHLPTKRQMFTTTWPWSVVPEAMILFEGEEYAAGRYSLREGVPDETILFQLAPLSRSESWLRTQPANLAEALR